MKTVLNGKSGDTITYAGHVKVCIADGNTVLYQNEFHNAGGLDLFEFSCQQ